MHLYDDGIDKHSIVCNCKLTYLALVRAVPALLLHRLRADTVSYKVQVQQGECNQTVFETVFWSHRVR